MKEPKEEVYIDAWTIADIINNYQDKRSDYPDLFEIVKGFRPFKT
jgi:hypothetical protein